MWLAVPLALLLRASVEPPAPQDVQLSKQTVLFYNARLALREGKAPEALKLWLLRNVVANDENHVGRYDGDYRSVAWAALGAQGLCGDGFPPDGEGAGLWPLAVHNQVVATLTKGMVPNVQNPNDAFDVGRQQRKVSLHDVLDPAELRTVTFFRTSCLIADTTMASLGKLLSVDEKDRLVSAPVMRALLKHALGTLNRDKLESVAVLEARIFDIDLAMVQMAERKARQEAGVAKQKGRRAGLSDAAAAENAGQARKWKPGSPQEALLKRSLTWSPDEWLTLSQQRRLFLFAQAKPVAESGAQVEALILGLIDRLAVRGQGEELDAWLGMLELKEPKQRGIIIAGERGKQLLALEPSTGFKERAVIALHRGVAELEAGQQLDALRSFGFAMAHADESSDPNAVMSLSRRWLSYVLSRFQTNGEVLGTLRALVPRQDYNIVIEELLWRAALRADKSSFELIASTVQKGSSLDQRIDKLKPMARGDVGLLATQLRDSAVDEPHFTLRFIRLLLEKLEAEDADVRLANIPMLKALGRVLDSIALSTTAAKSQARQADELLGRVQGILEGLKQFDTTEQGKARSLAVRHETFAGNIRLAPADALPWPFGFPEVGAASVFVPLQLIPLEWRNSRGELVFGWRVTE